jgi:hypothetical protein
VPLLFFKIYLDRNIPVCVYLNQQEDEVFTACDARKFRQSGGLLAGSAEQG